MLKVWWRVAWIALMLLCVVIDAYVLMTNFNIASLIGLICCTFSAYVTYSLLLEEQKKNNKE